MRMSENIGLYRSSLSLSYTCVDHLLTVVSIYLILIPFFIGLFHGFIVDSKHRHHRCRHRRRRRRRRRRYRRHHRRRRPR